MAPTVEAFGNGGRKAIRRMEAGRPAETPMKKDAESIRVKRCVVVRW